MRGATYVGNGGNEVIAVRDDLAEPDVGPDDALVEVKYAGLNRADVLERAGHYPGPKRDPVVPGLEYAGTVRDVGSRVTHVKVGDRVCGLVGFGAHAQRLSVNALALSKVPDGIELTTAASIPEAFMTASDALTSGGFALGRTVLVHAVGSSVGLAALELVKRGGGIAIGTSRTAAKLERARARGLDHGVLLDDAWPASVASLTQGRGVDVVLDFIGASILDANVSALAERGRIVQIGTLGGGRGTISLGPLMAKRASLVGTVMRSRPLDDKISLARRFERDLLPLFARGELHPEIDRIVPLERLGEAHAAMESDANYGKILISLEV